MANEVKYSGENTINRLINAIKKKFIKVPNTIEVGQTVIVDSVSAEGTPTEWRAITPATRDEVDELGIRSIEQTTTSNADGGYNIVTAILGGGRTSTFTIKNGDKGEKGDKGDSGAVILTQSLVVDGVTWHLTTASEGAYCEARCTIKPSATSKSFTVTFPCTIIDPFITYTVTNGALSFNTTCETTQESFTMNYDIGTIRAINIHVVGLCADITSSTYNGTTWAMRNENNITINEIDTYFANGGSSTVAINHNLITDYSDWGGTGCNSAFYMFYTPGESGSISQFTMNMELATTDTGEIFMNTIYSNGEPYSHDGTLVSIDIPVPTFTITEEPDESELYFLQTFCTQIS